MHGRDLETVLRQIEKRKVRFQIQFFLMTAFGFDPLLPTLILCMQALVFVQEQHDSKVAQEIALQQRLEDDGKKHARSARKFDEELSETRAPLAMNVRAAT